MVQLNGLIPYIDTDNTNQNGDIEIKILGLRQGEKMNEELSYDKDFYETAHPRIMTVKEEKIKLEELQKV